MLRVPRDCGLQIWACRFRVKMVRDSFLESWVYDPALWSRIETLPILKTVESGSERSDR